MNNKLLYILSAVILTLSLSCTKMDDYLKYTEGARRTYTGKLDTAYFHPGLNRLEFHGELSSDPKVTRIGIFWSSVEGDKEIMLDVEYSTQKTVTHVIEISEGSYNFVVYTYDSDGNSSIPVNVTGSSYGDNYIGGLFNRVVKSSEVVDGDIVIEWYGSSEDSPYSDVTYTASNGEERTVRVDAKEEITRLEDAKNNIYSIRSYFKPEENAIDVFQTGEAKIGHAKADVTAMYLKNYGVDDGNGRPNIERAGIGDPASNFDTPKDWKSNEAVHNYTKDGYPAFGGWSNDDGGRIAFRKWDNDGNLFENGKVWQTVTLPAGTYEFSTKYCRKSTEWNKAIVHIVVSEGKELPDHDPEYYRINNNSEWSKPEPDEPELQKSLAYKRLNEEDGGDKFNTVSFILEEETEVSLGLVVTINNNQHLDFSYFRLVQTN